MRRGMPKIRGGFSIPLGNYELLLAARLPQQFAIASAHQSKTALHETNGPIAQIVRFPGVLGDTLFAEENFGDHTISAPRRARIERPDGGTQPLASLFG